jgi:hypothetical protein
VRGWRDAANALRVRTFETRLHLMRGDLAEAVRWAAELGLDGTRADRGAGDRACDPGASLDRAGAGGPGPVLGCGKPSPCWTACWRRPRPPVARAR